jgi:N-hydroxyarylamine O-acetyltransferase
VHSVPFENLQLLRKNKRISLALDDLFLKIVTRRLGGFCFEINGLFGALLSHLGYSVEYVPAGVARERSAEGDASAAPVFHGGGEHPRDRFVTNAAHCS